MKARSSSTHTQNEIDELYSRLAEAEDTLRAIRNGEVDALIVSTLQGDQVYTLQGADQFYRVILETMNEGAVTLDASGTVLFSNTRLGTLLETPLQKVIGAAFEQFVAEADHPAFRQVFQAGLQTSSRSEVVLHSASGASISCMLSFSPLMLENPAVCVIVSDITQTKQAAEALKKSQERLSLLSHRLVDIQEKERRYVAQEIHDDAGQALTSMILEIVLLKRDAANPAAVIDHAQRLTETANNVLENLHRLAVNLRPASLDHLGLVATMEQYVKVTAASNQLDIKFQSVGFNCRLPADIEINLYRIAQEAVTNILRHARASRADIVLEKKADQVLLVIEDNGIGLEEESILAPTHLGLLGMHERAEMLGGHLTIESSPHAGVTIQLIVPLGPNLTSPLH